MQLRSKKTLAVASATLAVVGGGGAALAASGGSTSPTSFLDDVARHLGISSQKLKDATKAAAIDQVDAALKAGTITKEQADELKARINAGDVPPFFLFPRAFGFHEHFFVFGDKLSAAADYLGLSVAELRNRLAKGQSLADVAKAQGKSVDGLKRAIRDAVKKRLDAAVSNGALTKDQAKAILDRFEARLDDLVNRTFPGPGLGPRPFGGPGPRWFFGPRRGDPPPWGAAA
jgi:polyhydroxyalkanoate synthesis regulator phasin